MAKTSICIFVSLAIALTMAQPSLSKEKKDQKALFEELIMEMQKAKDKAETLVQEFIKALPLEKESGKRDLSKMKDLEPTYNSAKDAYRFWSLDVSTAVKKGEKVDMGSRSATVAKEKLKELSEFVTKYAEAREEADKKAARAAGVQNLDLGDIWAGIKAIAKFIKKNWGTIEKIVKEINKRLEELQKIQQQERDAIAERIEKAGAWRAFSDIRPQ